MGTLAAIGIQNADGTVTGVSCHYDGYLDHVGKILFENYNTEEKVRELLSHGNMSSLGCVVGEKHDFDDNNYDVTRYYGRDRGEEGQEPRTFTNSYEFVNEICASYSYLFDIGQWFVVDGLEEMMSLKEALEFNEDD